MSTDLHRNKVLALAAVFQAAALADSLAWKGQADADSRKALLDSLFIFESDDPAVIYGDISRLRLGLRTLEECLVDGGGTGGDNRQGDRLRYAMGLIHVERKLAGRDDLLSALRRRLEQAQAQLPHFEDGVSGSGMIRNLAGIYVDVPGTLPQRIRIKGNEQRLKSEGVPEQVRAVLLAGIRAAWLWHRLGGRRWHLLFTRGQILDELRRLIRDTRG